MNALGRNTQSHGDGKIVREATHGTKYHRTEWPRNSSPEADRQLSGNRSEAKTPRNDFFALVHNSRETSSYENF